MTSCSASVIIPAHNEQATIARTLASLLEDSVPGEFEVIVVCNGCTDESASEARSVGSGVTVVELPEASKIAALNEGDRRATCYPRLYLDADVQMTCHGVRALVEILGPGGAPCASLRPEIDVSGASWAVKAYFDTWSRLPYARRGTGGAGVYGLSAAGRARFGPFPDLVADDQFVMQMFADSERRTVTSQTTQVHAPRDLRSLVRVRSRVYRGNRQLRQSGLARVEPVGGAGSGLAVLALDPRRWPGLGIYVGVTVMARYKARREVSRWVTRRLLAHRPIVPRSDVKPTVGYVVGHYPAVSHVFVQREVRALRDLGVEVDTYSVHRTTTEGLLSGADVDEAARTATLLPISFAKLLKVHGVHFLRHPGAYLKTLAYALASAPSGARARLWQIFYFAEAMILYDSCKARPARHLHAHFANMGADVTWLAVEFANRAGRNSRWTWSFTMHGPTEFFAVEKFNLARKVHAATTVLCISEFCRSQLMLLTPEDQWTKLHVVHCGVDTRSLTPVDRSERAGGPLVVMCVGRLAPEKGQLILLDAVSQVGRDGIEVKLVLVGDGPLRSRLEDKAAHLGISDRVEFLGPVGQDRLPGLFAAADVFCLASFAEGLPVVLMEAMASGLPVVTTSIAAVSEMVVDGINGLLVPAGRSDLFAAAVERLAGDAELRDRLGHAARQTIEDEFDIRTCAARVAQLLDLAGSPSPNVE